MDNSKETKVCSTCSREYPLSEFSITRRTENAEYRHNLCRLCMNEKVREVRLKKKPLIPKGFEKLPQETQALLKENIYLKKYTLKKLAEMAGVAYGSLLYWIRSGSLK